VNPSTKHVPHDHGPHGQCSAVGISDGRSVGVKHGANVDGAHDDADCITHICTFRPTNYHRHDRHDSNDHNHSDGQQSIHCRASSVR
jgi:hypothetical protein